MGNKVFFISYDAMLELNRAINHYEVSITSSNRAVNGGIMHGVRYHVWRLYGRLWLRAYDAEKRFKRNGNKRGGMYISNAEARMLWYASRLYHAYCVAKWPSLCSDEIKGLECMFEHMVKNW